MLVSDMDGTSTSVEEQVFGQVSKLAALSLDVIILIILVFVASIVSVWLGKDRIISAIFSFYGAFVLLTVFPFQSMLSAEDPTSQFLLSLVAFFAFGSLIYTALSRFVATGFPHKSLFRFAEAATLGVVLASLIMLTLYHIVPLEPLYDFTEQIDQLFASPLALFWWIVADLAALILVVKR